MFQVVGGKQFLEAGGSNPYTVSDYLTTLIRMPSAYEQAIHKPQAGDHHRKLTEWGNILLPGQRAAGFEFLVISRPLGYHVCRSLS